MHHQQSQLILVSALFSVARTSCHNIINKQYIIILVFPGSTKTATHRKRRQPKRRHIQNGDNQNGDTSKTATTKTATHPKRRHAKTATSPKRRQNQNGDTSKTAKNTTWFLSQTLCLLVSKTATSKTAIKPKRRHVPFWIQINSTAFRIS